MSPAVICRKDKFTNCQLDYVLVYSMNQWIDIFHLQMMDLFGDFYPKRYNFPKSMFTIIISSGLIKIFIASGCYAKNKY